MEVSAQQDMYSIYNLEKICWCMEVNDIES